MKLGVNISIDVKKLNKDRFYQGKNGATYANMTVFIDPSEADQYGNNGGVFEQQSQEERERKDKQNYVGNVKVFWQGESDRSEREPEPQNSSDIPF